MNKEYIHKASTKEIRQDAEISQARSSERRKLVSRNKKRNRLLATGALTLALLPVGVIGGVKIVEHTGERLDNQARIENKKIAPIQEELEKRAQEKETLANLTE